MVGAWRERGFFSTPPRPRATTATPGAPPRPRSRTPSLGSARRGCAGDVRQSSLLPLALRVAALWRLLRTRRRVSPHAEERAKPASRSMTAAAGHLHEIALALAALSLLIWLYLLLFRGFFWVVRLPAPVAPPAGWPSVVAVVRARTEAAVVGEAVSSLLPQDYPGRFAVALVDDHSEDGTAEIARAAAASVGWSERLTVLGAQALPAGWTGKLWALSEGVRQVEERGDPPELFLFTDADIAHHRTNLAELVARLEGEGRDLVSIMVLLRCRSWAERLMIPAFVFFFAMLYPFAWSNDSRKRTAAAAGGCVLLRRGAFERSGGFAAIRGAPIDDCAPAKAVKASGGSTLPGPPPATTSLRPSPPLCATLATVPPPPPGPP